MDTTIDQLLPAARARLAGASDTPALDAELILAAVLGLSRAGLRTRGGQAIAPAERERIEALLARRVAGEPLAYLTGRREFWSLDLAVGDGVLVPRPETELLVEAALERLRERPAAAILDLGTGSGALALALAAELPRAAVTAVDASPAALDLARRNAAQAGLGRVRFLQGDWYAPVDAQRFDCIVANPPYLAASDPHLPALAHEPRGALVAGESGLEALAAIVAGAGGHLLPGGWLLLEHGAGQGAAVRGMCTAAGLSDVGTLRDLAGHERVTAGRRPAAAPRG